MRMDVMKNNIQKPVFYRCYILFFVFGRELNKKDILLPPNPKDMMITEQIKQLRKECRMAQKKLTAVFNIGFANYSKIKHAVCMAKWKHLPVLAKYMKTDANKLFTFWIACHIFEIVEDEKRISGQMLKVTQNM
jgi:hypothetical protein